MTQQEKRTLTIYGLLVFTLYAMWLGSQCFFYFYNLKLEKERAVQEEQHKRKKKELTDRLNYLQEKYKDELEQNKRAEQVDIFTLNYDDIEILAMNNYYESRGVGRKNWQRKAQDMRNITSVVLNRLDSGKYGSSIKQVIQAAKKKQNGKYVCQFSWVCNENRPAINEKSKEWSLAYEVAFDIYTGIEKRTVKATALHYYNPKKVKPRWAKRAKEVAYVFSGHKIIVLD